MCIGLWLTLAPCQKLVLWLERKSGMTTPAHVAYTRFTQPGKVDRAMAQKMDAQRQAGENPKIERRSIEFSHSCIIITHTVVG
jgi:hypothetical protein